MDASAESLALNQALKDGIPQIPYLVVLFVGMVLALAFMRRNPAVCGLGLAGLFILTFDATVMRFVTYYQIFRAWAEGAPWEGSRTLMNWVSGGFKALAFLLLLPALFGWRSRKTELWYD